MCVPPHRKDGSIPSPRALCSQSVDIQAWPLSAARGDMGQPREFWHLRSQVPVPTCHLLTLQPWCLLPHPTPAGGRERRHSASSPLVALCLRKMVLRPHPAVLPGVEGCVVLSSGRMKAPLRGGLALATGPAPTKLGPHDWQSDPGPGGWQQGPSPPLFPAGTSLVQHLMTVLIRKHGQLFTAPAPEGSTSPRRGPQCAVGWGSEEVTRDSQGEPCDPGLPAHRTSSLDGAAVAVLSRTAPTGPGSRCSPGKKVQTLPSWKSSFRQPGSRSGSPKGGGSSLEVPIISSGGNWFMNGLSSLRGHRRASSGDRLKDSGSVQRLSTYDNVPAPGLVPGIPSVASMVWSGASSESSVGGSLSSCTACRASDSSARSSLHTDWALEPSPLPSSSEDPKSLDLDHSLDETGTGASNSEPSEPGSPTREHARRSEALQGLVTELRAELCRQRTEYERSVKRIEEGSADLRKRMSRLEEELDQEKKKYIMLEIKLRNSERAREDAERRNQLLQREMEEFFSTLGSLTVGAKGARAPK
uniref:Rho GTPase activating protein 22 n=1 Tax=Theropithecus gelada TaxID=9565 RepID=A0A8D2F9L6_THEGE